MSIRSLVPHGFSKVVSGVVQSRKISSGKAPWTVSTTEVLCARMSSWISALACYEFFRKRHLPITDEAVMSLYLRLHDAAPRCSDDTSLPRGQVLQSSPALISGPNSISSPGAAVNVAHPHRGLKDSRTSKIKSKPLSFLILATEHQSTLRPLYHRLRFLLQGANLFPQKDLGKNEDDSTAQDDAKQNRQHAFLLDALPLLLAPCAIINISLRHNLRQRRWSDALRTIRNLYRYDLVERYLQELIKAHSWDVTDAMLAVASHDTCYRACVEAPSLLPLMDVLLVQWEEYWNVLKGKSVESQNVLTGSPFPATSSPCSFSASASLDAWEGENGDELTSVVGKEPDAKFKFSNDARLSPSAMRLNLEEKCLDVLLFASLVSAPLRHTVVAHVSSSKNINDSDQKKREEEEEVYHRLVEATTRQAEFTLCLRLATEWWTASKKGLPSSELHSLPSTATKELLLTRLLLRAPSCDIALQILDKWMSSFSSGSRSSDDLFSVQHPSEAFLRCPEVISALAARLSPAAFLREIVEERLQQRNILLDWHVRELVREALHRGALYDAAEKFCTCQAHLELAMCKAEEPNHRGSTFAPLIRRYLSQHFSTTERWRFISGLLRHMGEAHYPSLVEAFLKELDEETVGDACSSVAEIHEDSFLLLWVVRNWVTEDCCPGDAAVLLHHVVRALEMRESTSSEQDQNQSCNDASPHSRFTAKHAITSFSKAVAYLGLVVENNAPSNYIKTEIVVQWLKLLSEIPATHFDEEVLVVWLFWTMRALVQWEEQTQCPPITAAETEVVSAGVLKAIQNLSKTLEKCEVTAVLPPMLLNWLTARTSMSWADAAAWIARSAGKKTSQQRPFVFIRLPLGSSAFETVIDSSSRRRMLLAIENELYQHCRLVHSFRPSSAANAHLSEAVHELFALIRFTLLRTWYYHTLNAGASVDTEVFSNLALSSLDLPARAATARTARAINTALTAPNYEGIPSMKYQRKVHNNIVIHSLHETLRCLWEARASPQFDVNIPLSKQHPS